MQAAIACLMQAAIACLMQAAIACLMLDVDASRLMLHVDASRILHIIHLVSCMGHHAVCPMHHARRLLSMRPRRRIYSIIIFD